MRPLYVLPLGVVAVLAGPFANPNVPVPAIYSEIRNPWALAVRRDAPKTNWPEVLKKWGSQGKCRNYFWGGDPDPKASTAPCQEYCKQKNGGQDKGYGCKMFLPKGTPESVLKDSTFTDDNGKKFVMANCECECGLCSIIADTVIKGLQHIDKAICMTMLGALDTIANIGLMAVPGGQASAAARIAIRGAKTLIENGGKAADMFGGWVGPACGVSEFSFDNNKVFNALVNAPDSMGTSQGCMLPKKEDCKKPPARPDPPSGKKEGAAAPASKDTKKPATPPPPKTEKQQQPATIPKQQSQPATPRKPEAGGPDPAAAAKEKNAAAHHGRPW